MTLKLGPYKEGEIPPPVVIQFTDNAGVAIDLTGFTVKFHYRERGATAVTERSGTLEDAPNGKAKYTWVAGDFTTPGNYAAEMWVGNITNRYASEDIEYRVDSNLGVTPAI